MIVKGSKVKIKDNYSGNLDGVRGQIGTVVEVKRDVNPAVQSMFLLDIVGKYKSESAYSPGKFYTYSSQVVAFSDEIEEYSYGMTDCKGVLLEIGDQVVYSGNRPGIIEGEVVDFKDTEERKWGNLRHVTKVQLKITRKVRHSDGTRNFDAEDSYTQWFEHGSRMLITQKNMSNLVLFNNKDLRVIDC